MSLRHTAQPHILKRGTSRRNPARTTISPDGSSITKNSTHSAQHRPPCLPKSQTSSSSSRSAAARMLPVGHPIPNSGEWSACDHPSQRRSYSASTQHSDAYRNTHKGASPQRPRLMIVFHSRADKEEHQEQPDQVQGPMSPLPLHPRPQGRRQGREAEAELASGYVVTVWAELRAWNKVLTDHAR